MPTQRRYLHIVFCLGMSYLHHYNDAVVLQIKWSFEKDEVLINTVRDFPWLYGLYDKWHRSYKDQIKKKNSWIAINHAVCDEATGEDSDISSYYYSLGGSRTNVRM